MLVTIDPDTGIATEIGDPRHALNSLAFGADGTLYTVGGTNTPNDGRLLTISTVDATFQDFTGISGGGGQPGGGAHNIAFNPDDGLLYHIYDTFDFQMESIDLTDGSTTAVPVSGNTFQNILGFTYASSEGQFLAANNNWDWLTITATGLSTEVGTDTFGGDVARGLAFGLAPAACDFDGSGTCDFNDLDLMQAPRSDCRRYCGSRK